MVVEIPLTHGYSAVVDDEDVPLLSTHRWQVSSQRCGLLYARRSGYGPNGAVFAVLMHSVITGYPLTDHINGNGLDNRRANLRRATYTQNQWNRKKLTGKSQYKGVQHSAHVPGRPWRARIRVHKQTIHLGYFADEIDAARAYDDAARSHFGEFAAINFPRPGERCALVEDFKFKPI